MNGLPIQYGPGHGQPVDDWLEHLAQDNGMTSAHLCTTLRRHGATTRFLPVALTEPTARALAALTGTLIGAARAATLSRYDGTGALDLSGFDPTRWSTWRRVAARGWVHATGSSACPQCLNDDGLWQLGWRLPTTTVCPRHHAYLVDACPDCGRRLLDHAHTPLRRAAGTRCLNPITGRDGCQQDLRLVETEPASSEAVARQQRHDTALARKDVQMLGLPVPGKQYLQDARALAVLLLHLAQPPGAELLAGWCEQVRAEAACRTRWHLSPPFPSRLRSAVLYTADELLTLPNVEAATEQLAPWVELVPPGPESRLGWLADHTRMTPTLTRLVMATLAPHRRVSHALAARPRRLDQRMIPQVLPADLYHQHAAGLFTTREYTPRLFLSLCLARRTGAGTWAEAATLLGLDPDLGTRTARAVSARSTLDPHALTEVLDRIAELLDINYRVRRDAIGRLARRRAWFEDWSDDHRPGTRAESHRFAVTWLWEHWAHALVATSPGWPAPPDRFERALYRQFATSLRQPATDALTDIAHQTVQQEQR